MIEMKEMGKIFVKKWFRKEKCKKYERREG